MLAAGGGFVLAGCGGRPARMIAGDASDLRILAAALQSEREQVAFYEAGLRLSSDPILRTVLDQERAHAAGLEELIRELGGTPVQHVAIAAPRARSFGAWRQEALNAEDRWAAGYAAAIPKLSNPRLRGTFGALMTSEAEHGVALDLA